MSGLKESTDGSIGAEQNGSGRVDIAVPESERNPEPDLRPREARSSFERVSWSHVVLATVVISVALVLALPLLSFYLPDSRDDNSDRDNDTVGTCVCNYLLLN